jgi:colicin import membrane protein
MTKKSTLIVPMTLLAALAAGVLVHDRLRTKTLVQDPAPTPVSPPPVSAPVPATPEPEPPRRMTALQEASLVQDAAPTRTASIATAEPAAPALVSPPPVSAPVPATPEPEPPRRMTTLQEASLDAWMIKTYLTCWKPAAQPGDANRYVARVRLKFKPDGSLLRPPKLVNPPSDPAQKPQATSVLQAVKACDPLPMPAQYRSFYEQWKTKTILFDPQVAAR